MDARIIILYQSVVSGHVIGSSVETKKSEIYADNVDAEHYVNEIMKNGVWVKGDNVREYVPPHSILNILVQDIPPEETADEG